MTTPVALLANRCGLSQREAAEYLDVRLDTFKAWAAPDRNPAKPFAVVELRALYAKIEAAADHTVREIRHKVPVGGAVELGYCADDHEAQSLGFPFASCHRAMLGIVVGRVDDRVITLVPRGSTMGTAAAMQAHGF